MTPTPILPILPHPVIILGVYIFTLFTATLILYYLHHHLLQEDCLTYTTPTIH